MMAMPVWSAIEVSRARSLPVWAALRTLGRAGVADLIERCCALARRFADGLATIPGVRVLNDVVLNQIMVRFGDDDATTAHSRSVQAFWCFSA